MFNATPNGSGASFWGSGAGPACDSSGNVFAVSANGDFNAATAVPDLGDSVIKLSPANGLAIEDYFTPFNQAELSEADLDLGSSGAVLLPPEVGSGAHPNLLVTAGKEGLIYLVDRDAMGGYNSSSDAGAVQTVPLAGKGLFGPPAYFSGNLYFSTKGDQLRAFQISNGQMSPTPTSSSSMTFASPGSSPIVSANGDSNGIVWAFEIGTGEGVLHAFDATNLATELFSDEVGSFLEFNVPTEADGKVYLGLNQFLAVYGLLPSAPGTLGATVNAASFNASIAPGSLISIFGEKLARASVAASAIPLPASLADTSVLINGVRASLLYVSNGQINAQVPAGTGVGTATVSVISSGALTPAGSFEVVPAAPEIFIAGTNRVVALNEDGSPNTETNGAAPGSVLQIFLTGAIAFTNPAASIGGAPAQFTYAGPAPGTVGVEQVNLRVPDLPPGDYQLQISLGGASSNSGLISVD